MARAYDVVVQPMAIDQALSPTDEVRTLVGELEALLAADYTPEQRHGLSVEALFRPHLRFFVARMAGAAVGCGGVALFPDFAEVKRL
jgi:putative acetyltransferase